MTLETFVDGHPAEADLLRLIDSELEEVDSVDIKIHLAECISCRRAVEEMEEASVQLSDFLEHLSTPERSPQPVVSTAGTTGWLRAAAIVLLIGAATMAVEPVRAWVIDQFVAVASIFGDDAASDAVATAPASESSLTFDVGGPRLEVVIATTQAVGEITFVRSTVAQATATVVGGGSESFLLLAGVVRVQNREDSGASYRFTLPDTINEITLSIGGNQRSIALTELDSASVNLQQ